ncbi:hypothetical protein CYMTET_9649 [Cymbomonas tetramitiformis]|uniref:Uncharacterized protein n=1 Tax=Cymbomonas tetramitiformis TaxID=36881 RepID=A0AAE0GR22_9CHLO|nr:hypothetical protein CYMTET_9649 [Cymbomonas tetramitiformis]
MRERNLKHVFPKHKMGITTEECLKLPEAKEQRTAASAEVQDRLAAELSSMQTAGQAGGGKGAEAQALSDDEEDEAEYDSNFNEREEYAADAHVGSAGEEVIAGERPEHIEDITESPVRSPSPGPGALPGSVVIGQYLGGRFGAKCSHLGSTGGVALAFESVFFY